MSRTKIRKKMPRAYPPWNFTIVATPIFNPKLDATASGRGGFTFEAK